MVPEITAARDYYCDVQEWREEALDEGSKRSEKHRDVVLLLSVNKKSPSHMP